MPEIPNILIFLKSQRSQDIKNDILDCQIHKYTNTKTQIHKYKDKNTQTHCDEVPEIPNMCYIFEKAGVQGHQKWYCGLSKIQIHRRCDNYVFPNLKLWTTDPLTDFYTVPPGLLCSNWGPGKIEFQKFSDFIIFTIQQLSER